MTDRSRMAPPTKEEYDQLFGELQKGSESAKQELVERHIRLVASIALKFRKSMSLWRMLWPKEFMVW